MRLKQIVNKKPLDNDSPRYIHSSTAQQPEIAAAIKEAVSSNRNG